MVALFSSTRSRGKPEALAGLHQLPQSWGDTRERQTQEGDTRQSSRGASSLELGTVVINRQMLGEMKNMEKIFQRQEMKP